MSDEPRRPRRDAIAPIVGLVVPDPVPREHTGPVHFDPASIDRPTVERRQAIPTITGPGLLTYGARRTIDDAIGLLVDALGYTGDDARRYAVRDMPDGKCRLTIDVVFDAATANERNK